MCRLMPLMLVISHLFLRRELGRLVAHRTNEQLKVIDSDDFFLKNGTAILMRS